MPQFVILQPRY